MNVRHLAASAIVASALASGSAVQPAAAEPRAVLELFTSQGCSSCPAADKLLGELADDPSLITMSLPVDYWDYLGWKDTLALNGHTKRERAYAEARGDRQVYTPQVVVNGVTHVIGSDRAKIERTIADARAKATLDVPVKVSVAGGAVTAEIAAAKTGAKDSSGEVWLCPTKSKVSVEIERGENRGKTITYHNVVRGWVKLGDWKGQAQTFTLPMSQVANTDADRFVVIVQGGAAAKPGPMLGAATAALK